MIKRFAPRTLIWLTLFLLLVVTGGVWFSTRSHRENRVEISYKEHPTIGNRAARIHLVVFEEPKCINCARFTQEIFPRIKEEYIDTNKITYTVIPVSFLTGSMPAATALLCIYNADPLYPNSELFFDYLDTMYKQDFPEGKDWATVDELVKIAEKTSPAINPKQLEKCIDMQTYRIRIEKNTTLGKELMNGRLRTPTLYVNGSIVSPLTYDNIKQMIDEVHP